jgi:hypothetical protein
MIKFNIRPMVETDKPFIGHSFATSLRAHRPYLLLPNEYFYTTVRLLLKDIFNRKSTEVLVACNPSDNDHLLGYIISGDKHILYFIYVKKAGRTIGPGFRQAGIGTALLNSAFCDVHSLCYVIHTPSMVHLSRWKMVYSPEMISEHNHVRT